MRYQRWDSGEKGVQGVWASGWRSDSQKGNYFPSSRLHQEQTLASWIEIDFLGGCLLRVERHTELVLPVRLLPSTELTIRWDVDDVSRESWSIVLLLDCGRLEMKALQT